MNNLPTTRFALFKDIMRYRFSDLFFVSLYTMLFFTPALMWIVFVNYSFLSEFDNIYNPLVVYGVLALLISLGGQGIGGAFYFYKKLVFNEGAVIHHDFFVGVRENRHAMFIVFLLIGVMYGALHFGEVVFFLDETLPTYVGNIYKGIMYVSLFFIAFSSLFVGTQSVVYTNTLRKTVQNGMRFTFGNILQTLLFGSIIFLPFFIYEFVPNVYVEYIVLLVTAIFYSGFSLLIFTLYAHSVFDKTINKRQFPELIRKGLLQDSFDEFE